MHSTLICQNTLCVARYLNALQTTAQHLLRYLAAAVVVNKRRRNAMKDLIRVIEQEAYEYSDPITQFLECLFVRYDFEGAQVKLRARASTSLRRKLHSAPGLVLILADGTNNRLLLA